MVMPSVEIIRSNLGDFWPSARFICLLNCNHAEAEWRLLSKSIVCFEFDDHCGVFFHYTRADSHPCNKHKPQQTDDTNGKNINLVRGWTTEKWAEQYSWLCRILLKELVFEARFHKYIRGYKKWEASLCCIWRDKHSFSINKNHKE